MGLFSKKISSFFGKSEESDQNADLEYKEFFESQRYEWYLTEEAEKQYRSLEYQDRISFVYDYLLKLRVCGEVDRFNSVKRDPFELKIRYEDSRSTIETWDGDYLWKLSHLLVFFMIDSSGLLFSGYTNALSEKTNKIIAVVKNDRMKPTLEQMIDLLHEDSNAAESNYLDSLTSYWENKEMYKVERAMISIFSDETVHNYFFLTDFKRGALLKTQIGLASDSEDSLYEEVVEFVRVQQKASTSLLQRRFGIGFNRAARLIDTLEDNGIIGPPNGSNPREVYLDDYDDDDDLD